MLPKPPSINQAYKNRGSGKGGKGRFASPELKKWRQHAELLIRIGNVPRFHGAVNIDITIDEGQDRRREDADNRMKPVIDQLVASEVLEDDNKKIVRRVAIGWGSVEPGMISVTITECEQTSVPRETSKTSSDKSWAVRQLKRKFGIDIAPSRIHL